MAATQGVNVLRYSALFAGVFYGFYHQTSLSAQSKQAQIDREYDRKASLIEQAKAAYVKKDMPQKEPDNSVVTDPDDARFDLESFLKMKAEEK